MSIQKPTLSIFSGDENFGSIFNESNQINTKTVAFSIPLTTTTGRLEFNLLGKERIITVQGANSGNGFTGASDNAKIRNFIEKIEDWVNTNVQTKRVYFDSFGVPYDVICLDFQWRRSFSDPNRILWSFLLKQVGV